MQTVEIPREAWAQTLNEFTAIHEGWLVSLDVLGADIGAPRRSRGAAETKLPACAAPA